MINIRGMCRSMKLTITRKYCFVLELLSHVVDALLHVPLCGAGGAAGAARAAAGPNWPFSEGHKEGF